MLTFLHEGKQSTLYSLKTFEPLDINKSEMNCNLLLHVVLKIKKKNFCLFVVKHTVPLHILSNC